MLSNDDPGGLSRRDLLRAWPAAGLGPPAPAGAAQPPSAAVNAHCRFRLTFYDVYGTQRFVELDPKRTAKVVAPLSESPVYIVGPPGLKTAERKNPGTSV